MLVLSLTCTQAISVAFVPRCCLLRKASGDIYAPSMVSYAVAQGGPVRRLCLATKTGLPSYASGSSAAAIRVSTPNPSNNHTYDSTLVFHSGTCRVPTLHPPTLPTILKRDRINPISSLTGSSILSTLHQSHSINPIYIPMSNRFEIKTKRKGRSLQQARTHFFSKSDNGAHYCHCRILVTSL